MITTPCDSYGAGGHILPPGGGYGQQDVGYRGLSGRRPSGLSGARLALLPGLPGRSLCRHHGGLLVSRCDL